VSTERIIKTVRKYEPVRQFLCEKHNRKCLTTKCPMAKFYCYEHVNLHDVFDCNGGDTRNKIIATLKQVAKENRIEV